MRFSVVVCEHFSGLQLRVTQTCLFLFEEVLSLCEKNSNSLIISIVFVRIFYYRRFYDYPCQRTDVLYS
jgi:hypothetical protein